jgi:cytidylate kinase
MLDSIRPIIASLRATPLKHPERPETPKRTAPFVTISREPGAGAVTLGRVLADRLSRALPGERPWTCWDRDAVDAVTADAQTHAQVVDALEASSHSWLAEFLGGLSMADHTEAKLFSKTAATIRALAEAGRVVIIGRGGVLITRKLPGGVHVRLVAPLEHRIAHVAEYYQISRAAAANKVKELEHNQQVFFKRYWPETPVNPEMFTLTINTQQVDQEGAVGLIVSLVERNLVRRA